MNNNDDKERWETFCKLYDKLSSKEEMRELFEEEIKCFSLYLSHVNQDYVYNATFLPQFNDDFWNFLCAFNKKYKIVEKLFDVAEKYYNVTLKIDRYWMMTVDEKGKIKKSTLSGVDYINYDKQDNISDTTKYEDHFVAENRLIAISKSGRSMDSEDVQNFLNATERGIDVQLFVRKNKDDKISKEFYYLGRVIATGNAKQFVMPNTDKTAVEIEWELETPVREDIYQYIVNE